MNKSICPCCRKSASFSFKAKDYNRQITNEIYDYYECDYCELIFISPIPENLGKYYPETYYELPKTSEELNSRAKATQQGKIDVILPFIDKGRLLEIGPAYGLFSYLAKTAGFDVTAIEMDARCCEYLRDVIGINVVEGSDTIDLLRQCEQFDVIVLWQVIEHLPDPWSVISAAIEHLAPGGFLIVDTPNPDAIQFRVLGSRWVHVDAPRHVTLIPHRLMVTFIEKLGLQSVLVSANGAIAKGYNSFGWAYSLKNIFSNQRIASLAFYLGRIISKTLIPLERTGSRGSTYTAVFKKV
jgi:2-polyprenyl-3-methyl-5-hydroxy-6-metoxy-1,4-benzoquinol methylase